MTQNNNPSLPRRLRTFLETEAAGGVVMLLFAAFAMLAANSGLADTYKAFITFPVAVSLDQMTFEAPLKMIVKDVLMPFFFLVVGLELKHEMLDKKGTQGREGILLPLLAALGGMIVPALFYTAITFSHADLSNGWAIPAATDIAFALCVLSLAGKNAVPPAVKIFLLAVAIYDGGAVLQPRHCSAANAGCCPDRWRYGLV